MRTAYNIIIYEALDFTTGLFTPRGETISIGIGLPMFIRGMAETVKAKIRHFGADRIRPGDIYVTNDSYITGSHLNHVTLTLPIFHAGELVAFSCCMAHWLDIGGILGGMSTDIFSEGLQIPILKYLDQGVVNQTLVDFIRQNVRVPSRAMGDLRAQVTAVKTGERRFLELIGRYGRHAVVRVVVQGDEMTVDLSEVSAQVRGFYNSGITTGHACAQVAYKCITSPRDYPINDGSFRSLRTIVPPGRVISAVRPAPMRWWMTYPMTIVDTIFKALAPAIPARVIAGHHADLLAAYFHGINDRTDEFFIGSFGPLGGGWGAKKSEDGVSATVCINDGDTHNSPNEQAEFKFPIVVERYALIADSGGAGRRRGGLGVERVVRARSNMVVNNQSERAHCRPWGLAGGLDGTGNAVELRIGGHWKSDFPNAKVLVAQLRPGDAFKVRSGGGGGYGSPLERPIAQVVDDVRQGYVTVTAAAELYGVIIDPQTFAADQASTDKLRARLRSQHEQRGAAAVAQAVPS
jgi:N-methylhydantoinase B